MYFSSILLYLSFLTTYLFPPDIPHKTFAWENMPNQAWLGNDFWANPLQDWQVKDGRVECLVQKHNRNFRLLSYVLDSSAHSFSTSVRLGFLDKDIPVSDDTFMGWEFGCRGTFDHYKDDVVKGKGWRIGISTSGQFFLNGVCEDANLNLYGKPLFLVVKGAIEENGFYAIRLEVKHAVSKKVLAYIEQKNIPSKNIEGHAGFAIDFSKNVFKSDFNERVPSVWLDNFNIYGDKWAAQPEKKFADVILTKYTLDDNQLRLSAQLPPVAILPNMKVVLDIEENGVWQQISTTSIDPIAKTGVFTIPNWDINNDIVYRVRLANSSNINYATGIIEAVPQADEKINIVSISCIGDHAFPYATAIEHIKAQKPDFLFFAGDQIYEFDKFYGNANHMTPLKTAQLNYFYKWLQYAWSFQDLLANKPSVLLLDDHDMYQGNLWGNSGVLPQKSKEQMTPEDGGFLMGKDFVNMVQKTQIAHLPDTYSTVKTKGMDNYFGDLHWAGISFAILEDRKFKSAPLEHSAHLKGGYEKKEMIRLDKKGLKLLGEEQLVFLENWSQNWQKDTWQKIALSQTIFSQLTTTPDKRDKKHPLPLDVYPERKWYKDFDSNGWPQTGRNKAVALLRSCTALHLCGDQHLGITAQYGVDGWRDASYVMASPALSNVYPRTWYPPTPGQNMYKGSAKNLGDFRDGFNNYVTVKAAYNQYPTGVEPASWFDKGVGYGIATLDPTAKKISLAIWALHENPNDTDAKPCKGWPIRLHQSENLGLNAKYFLPQIYETSQDKLLIQVINEANGVVEYTYPLSMKKAYTLPNVRKLSSYTIKVSSFEDLENVVEFKGIEASPIKNEQVLQVSF